MPKDLTVSTLMTGAPLIDLMQFFKRIVSNSALVLLVDVTNAFWVIPVGRVMTTSPTLQLTVNSRSPSSFLSGTSLLKSI